MSRLLLSVTAGGRPRPQGSLQLWSSPDGKERAKYNRPMVEHRNYVIGLLRDAWGDRPALACEVGIQCEFRFERPKSHYGTGRNSSALKSSAPRWMTSAPDVDKLMRLALDSCQIAALVKNDSQFVILHGEKVWAERSETLIEIWEI